ADQAGPQTAAKAQESPGWAQTGTRGEFDPGQLEIIQKVNDYFNSMGDTKGEFVQVSADGKRLRGQIFIKRTNLFRFQYRRPSRQLIISDGTNMIIQDLDLKTDDRWGLDRTPFRILLRRDVDLMRDAQIKEVGESEERYFITLKDKDPETLGSLKLFFLKEPAVALAEWITTDSQGQDTRIQLTEFVRADNLDKRLFEPQAITLQKLRQ